MSMAKKSKEKIPQSQQYTIYIERDDMFADPQRFPDGVAWRSGVRDEHGEEIDGGGDIASYEEAKELALNALRSYFAKGEVDREEAVKFVLVMSEMRLYATDRMPSDGADDAIETLNGLIRKACELANSVPEYFDEDEDG